MILGWFKWDETLLKNAFYTYSDLNTALLWQAFLYILKWGSCYYNDEKKPHLKKQKKSWNLEKSRGVINMQKNKKKQKLNRTKSKTIQNQLKNKNYTKQKQKKPKKNKKTRELN